MPIIQSPSEVTSKKPVNKKIIYFAILVVFIIFVCCGISKLLGSSPSASTTPSIIDPGISDVYPVDCPSGIRLSGLYANAKCYLFGDGGGLGVNGTAYFDADGNLVRLSVYVASVNDVTMAGDFLGREAINYGWNANDMNDLTKNLAPDNEYHYYGSLKGIGYIENSEVSITIWQLH